MIAINTTYLTDAQGNTLFAVVPIKEFNEIEKIIEEYEYLEDLEDLRLYHESKKDETLAEPMDVVFKRIEQKQNTNGK